MKTLEIKKDQLVKELETLVRSAKDDKGNARALNTDEKQKFDNMKAEAEQLAERISQEKFIMDNQKKERGFDKEEKKFIESFDAGRSIRNYVAGRAQEGADREAQDEAAKEFQAHKVERRDSNSLLIPSLIFRANESKRASQTTSNQSSLVQSILSPEIQMVQYPILHQQLGVTQWQAGPGNFVIPNFLNIRADYVAENVSGGTVAFTSGQKSFAPKWLPCNVAISKQMIASTVSNYTDQIVSFAQYAIQRGIDFNLVKDISGSTVATTGATRTYKSLLAMKNGIPNGRVFLSSNRANTFWSVTPQISGGTNFSAIPAIYNSQLAGAQVFSSFDAPAGFVSFFDPLYYNIVQWNGTGAELLIDPYTLSQYGVLQLSVGKLMNQGISATQAFAVNTNSSFV